MLKRGRRQLDDTIIIDPRHSGDLPLAHGRRYRKGQEMGWFEHGSTIIVLGERGATLAADFEPGAKIRMGEGLMRFRAY